MASHRAAHELFIPATSFVTLRAIVMKLATLLLVFPVLLRASLACRGFDGFHFFVGGEKGSADKPYLHKIWKLEATAVSQCQTAVEYKSGRQAYLDVSYWEDSTRIVYPGKTSKDPYVLRGAYKRLKSPSLIFGKYRIVLLRPDHEIPVVVYDISTGKVIKTISKNTSIVLLGSSNIPVVVVEGGKIAFLGRFNSSRWIADMKLQIFPAYANPDAKRFVQLVRIDSGDDNLRIKQKYTHTFSVHAWNAIAKRFINLDVKKPFVIAPGEMQDQRFVDLELIKEQTEIKSKFMVCDTIENYCTFALEKVAHDKDFKIPNTETMFVGLGNLARIYEINEINNTIEILESNANKKKISYFNKLVTESIASTKRDIKKIINLLNNTNFQKRLKLAKLNLEANGQIGI